jgi:hypothetical protein
MAERNRPGSAEIAPDTRLRIPRILSPQIMEFGLNSASRRSLHVLLRTLTSWSPTVIT